MPSFPFPARTLALALAACALLAPPAFGQAKPDYSSSDNVELVGRLKEAGDGVGARVIGNMLYVTSTTHLLIYDITNAESPDLQGVFTLNIEFENEEVPTNGKILGISADTFCVVPDQTGVTGTSGDTDCLTLYDVSDPANVKFIKNLTGAGSHTSTCVLDCTYFFGDGGKIIDARVPKDAKLLEANWWNNMVDKYGIEVKNGCHHVREISPGVMLGSCNPVVVMSVLPEHGGSIETPALLALGLSETNTLVHSSRWPREGRDKFVLVGEETNLQRECSDAIASFQTWDASKVINPMGGFLANTLMTKLDEYRPTNGTYVDGKSPYNALGCSVHWFQEHPTFRNGGLVAVAAYENGTRFLQVAPDGKLTEQGYFLPLQGSTSAPHWHPNGKVVYNIDYTRGIDILRWTGDTYVPTGSGDVFPTPGAKPGTGGLGPDAPACASAAGFRSAEAKPAGKKVELAVNRREQQPFTVDIFQQSAGSKVVKERLIRRFTKKTKSFVWDGKDRKKRKLADGNYFVRFTMKLQSGARDVRRATLTRTGGKFKLAPDFYQRIDCGIFKSLKLSSSVFGGRTREPLRIAYKLEVPARSVKLEVRVGSRLVKTITGGGTHGRTFRYSLPASIARKGQLVTVTATPDREGGATASVVLTAKRI